MLDFMLYMFFSMLETFAMFILAFSMFKIDVEFKEIVFAGFIMAFFSYIIRAEHNWVELDIVVQYLLMFCFYWFLFRIHVFYAAILTGISYQAYTFIQSIYILLFDMIGNFSYHSFYGLEHSAYFLQISSAVSAALAGCYIGIKRKGFDFIPDKSRGPVQISIREKFLFFLNLPTAVIVISIKPLYSSDFFFMVPVTYGFLLLCYIYLSYKKDRSRHEYLKL